jgi:hypothetical protein
MLMKVHILYKRLPIVTYRDMLEERVKSLCSYLRTCLELHQNLLKGNGLSEYFVSRATYENLSLNWAWCDTGCALCSHMTITRAPTFQSWKDSFLACSNSQMYKLCRDQRMSLQSWLASLPWCCSFCFSWGPLWPFQCCTVLYLPLINKMNSRGFPCCIITLKKT